MLQAIMAIHSILFRAMEQELDPESMIPPGIATSTVSELLQLSVPGEQVAAAADHLTSQYGSPALVQVNATLDAWRRNWDARKQHDHYSDVEDGFVHPLNFWYLAKLFILVHLKRGHASNDDDVAALYRDKSLQNTLQTQLRVIGWMRRLRQVHGGGLASSGSFLSQVINK